MTTYGKSVDWSTEEVWAIYDLYRQRITFGNIYMSIEDYRKVEDQVANPCVIPVRLGDHEYKL